MKKAVATLLAAAMVFSVAACGNKKDGKTTKMTEGTAATEAESEAQEELAEPEYVSAFDLEKLSDYIELGEYKGIQVTAQDTAVTDEEVEAELQSQVENATPIYEEKREGTVADKDVVNIDYVGKEDGVAFDGGTGENFNLTIGSGQFIDGFEEGLIGKNIGETVDLNLTFPEVYENNPDLAGKPVVFTVTINYVQGEEIPQELNDEFVQRVSDECKTVEEYRAYVRKDLEETKAANAENSKANEAWEKIMNNASYPNKAEELITYAHDSQLYQFNMTLSMYGMDMDGYLSAMGTTEEEFEADLMEYCENAAKSQLLIRAIVEAENITLTDEVYQAECEKLAGDLGTTAENLQTGYPEQMVKDAVFQNLVREFVMKNIVEVAGEPEAESSADASAQTSAAESSSAAQ